MSDKPPSPIKGRTSMIGSAFAVVKNYFTPERASHAPTSQSVGITPLVRNFAALTLDESSHDSTDSFRTTFSQQEDSFQSVASYAENDCSQTPEGSTDQTIVLDESLIELSANDSSSSSIDRNCTVNDGIDNSVILVSCNNDSPQIVYASVSKNSAQIKEELNEASANLSHEFYKNINEVLENVNDDGSIFSDIDLNPNLPTNIDNSNDIMQEKNSVIDKDVANQIKNVDSQTNSIEGGGSTNDSIPVTSHAKFVDNLSAIFIPEIVVISNENNGYSPVSELINSKPASIDSAVNAKICDVSLPGEITVAEIAVDCPPKSDIAETPIAENINVLSAIKDKITLDDNDRAAVSKIEDNKEPCSQTCENSEILNSEKESELISSEVENIKNETVIEIVPIMDISETENTVKGMLNAASNLPVPLATTAASVKTDPFLDITNELQNATIPPECADALFNVADESFKSALPIETLESVDALLNNTNGQNSSEPLLTLDTAESTHLVLNVINEPLKTTEETADVILNSTSEPINSTVPLLTSDSVESFEVLLNATNEPLSPAQPVETVESCVKVLNISSEQFNATVPLQSSDTVEKSDAFLIVANETLNSSLSTETVVSSDAVSNVISEQLDSTVSLPSSDNAENVHAFMIVTNETLNSALSTETVVSSDAVLNVISEPLDSTVLLTSSDTVESSDTILDVISDKSSSDTDKNAITFLNAINEPLYPSGPTETVKSALLNETNGLVNISTASITSDAEESDCALLDATNEPLNTTVPLLHSETPKSANAALNVTITESSLRTDCIVPLPAIIVTADCAEVVSNRINETLSIAMESVVISETSVRSEPILSVSIEPVNTNINSEECTETILDVTNDFSSTNLPVTSNDSAIVDVAIEQINPSVTLVKLVLKLNDLSEPAITAVPIVESPTNTTVSAIGDSNSAETLNIKNESTAVAAEIEDCADAVNMSDELINTTVPVLDDSDVANVTVDRENANSVDLNISHEPVITSASPIVTEIVDSTDALVNMSNELINTTEPVLEHSDAANVTLNISHEHVITSSASPIVSETVDCADALVNMSNELINTTVPVLENSDAGNVTLNITDEHVCQTVDHENANSVDLNISQKPVITSASPIVTEIVDRAHALVNMSHELINTTEPVLHNSDVANVTLNITNEHVSKTENTDSVDLNISHQPVITSTSPIVTEIEDCADALVNMSNELNNTTVPVLDNSDAVNMTLNITNEHVCKTETTDCVDLNISREHVITSASPMKSEIEDCPDSSEAANVTLNISNENACKTVGPENADSVNLDISQESAIPSLSTIKSEIVECTDAIVNTTINLINSSIFETTLNISSGTNNTTTPLLIAENSDKKLNISNDHVITPVPLVKLENADSADAKIEIVQDPVNDILPEISLNISNEFCHRTVPIVSSENAGGVTGEPTNANVPVVVILNVTPDALNNTETLLANSDNEKSANATLNISNELITSVPLAKSEIVDRADIRLENTHEAVNNLLPEEILNKTNELCTQTMSTVTSEIADRTAEESLNTTVPVFVGKVDADLNVTNESLQNTEHLLANEINASVTSDSANVPNIILSVTNDALNFTEPLIVSSENSVELSNEPVQGTEVVTSESSDNQSQIVDSAAKGPYNTTVPVDSILNSENANATLNEFSNATVSDNKLEIAGTASANLNVTNEPLFVVEKENAILRVTNEPVFVAGEGNDVLNVTHESSTSNFPVEMVESSDISLIIANTTAAAASETTECAEAILSVTNEPKLSSANLLSSDPAESTASYVPLETITNNAVLNPTQEPANTAVSLNTEAVYNILNMSNISISLPHVTLESERSIDDILDISNVKFVETIAEHTSENKIEINNKTEGSEAVENILNISNIAISVPHVTLESDRNIDDILNISNVKFVETIADASLNNAVSDKEETEKITEEVLNNSDSNVSLPELVTTSEKPMGNKITSITAKLEETILLENACRPETCSTVVSETLSPPKTPAEEIFVVSTPPSDIKLTNEEPSLNSIINKTEEPINFDKYLEDFQVGDAPLPSLDLDVSEMLNDCESSPETAHFNTEAYGELIKENTKRILTPISESRENSFLNDSPAFNINKAGNSNLLQNSIPNRLFFQQSSATFDVSPINACSPLVSHSLSPMVNSLTNSPMEQEKLLQSTPEAVNVNCSIPEVNEAYSNDSESKPRISADFNLNTTHVINVGAIPKSLNETQVISKPCLNDTVTLSSFTSMDTTRVITEEITKNRTLLDSTIVLEKSDVMDPNATVLITGKSDNFYDLENSEENAEKIVKSNNISVTNNSPFQRKPLTSVENKKMQLQNLSEMLFDLNTHENGIVCDNNKSKNMSICVLKDRTDNKLENNMGAGLGFLHNIPSKSPVKFDSLDDFNDPVFSNAADFDIFNTDFQPPSGVTGRESLYLKFDPLYSAQTKEDNTIFVSPLLPPDNESSLEKLKAEVSRLHQLFNKREDQANERLNFYKLRNEEINTKCQIEQEKLEELARRRHILEDKIQKNETVFQQMNTFAGGYKDIISAVGNDLQKMKEEQTDVASVQSELDSSKRHLKSAEDAFMDVLAKYEKLSATVPELKASNEQKKKMINELQRESVRIDERVKFCESNLAAEMEEIKRAAKVDNDQFGIETTRLTAQLRKNELTYKNTKDTFDNIVVENDKLSNLCDDIIAGKS